MFIKSFIPQNINNLIINSPTKKILFSLIIPTYNESENIKLLILKLSQLLDQLIPEQYELILVDDNSPDYTWKIAQELSHNYPQLQVIHRRREKGLSTAVIRGWQASQGEILGVIDADLQHPPATLIKLWQEMEKGADLAVASRHVEGGGVSEWSLWRRFLSRGAQILGLIILPNVMGKVSDPMSGYFFVRRRCLFDCQFNPLGYKILVEVLAKAKIGWISEVGYVFQERKEGKSKVNSQHYIDYIKHLIRFSLSVGQFSRFIRFGLVGLSGVFVDMTILYLLSDNTTLALPLTLSKIVAAELAIINNFFWNDAWTFQDIARQQPSKKQKIKRLIKFNLVCFAGLVINVFVLNLCFNFFGLNRYLANLIAIALVTIWNYWINLKLSWRSTEI